MLILEQWPRQIAPAAGGTLASNFRVLRLDQPARQPSQLSWTTPVKVVSRLAWGASTQLSSFPQHCLLWAGLCSALPLGGALPGAGAADGAWPLPEVGS